MKIIIKGIEYNLGEPVRDGGEGEIYELKINNELKCVKIYYPDKRTAYAERKVIALINRFEAMDFGNVSEQIAYPEIPVYEADSNEFCGFLMKYFNNHRRLMEITYSKNTKLFGDPNLSDEDAVLIIDKLYYYIKVLHRVGFIIGDLNPENILINELNNTPALVDIDSFQIGTYYSNSRRKDYIDPAVKVDGYGKAKYFIYSTDSDIFSMAIIAYEFLVGSRPHFYQTVKPTDTNYKKEIHLSLLDYFIDNRQKLDGSDITLFKDDLYFATIQRIDFLKNNFFEIFTFLKSVFADGKRYYFYYKDKKEIKIQKRKGILSLKDTTLIPHSKEDPEELQLFLDQYQITLP
jgi:DNA-binding helix-hairpin-helix protein with protein kinase domain